MSETTWKEQTRLIFARLKGKHANKKCFECPNRNPSWASIPYGIFICANCAGIHRKLGTHLSFVRSTNLDEWSEAQVKRMVCGGNEKANAFFRRYNINCSGGRSTVIENKYSSKAAKTYRTNLDNEARVSTLQNAPGTSPKGDEKGGGDLADLMGGFGLGDKDAAPPKKKPIVAKPKKDPSESLIYKEKKKIEEKGKNLVLKKTGSSDTSRNRTPRRSPKDIKAVPKKRFGSNKKKLKKTTKSKSSLISMDSDSSDDSDSDFERQVQAAIAKAKEAKAEKEEEKKKELKAKPSASRTGSNRTTSNSYRNNTTNSYNSSISIQEKIKRKANRSGNVTSFSSQDFFDQEDAGGGQDEEMRRSKFQSASAIGSDAYFNRPTQGDESNGADFNWDDMRYEAAEKARQVTSAASSWIKDLSDKFRSGS